MSLLKIQSFNLFIKLFVVLHTDLLLLSEEKTKYYVCLECGEEVPEHEAYEKDGETCLCGMCYFGWEDEQ